MLENEKLDDLDILGDAGKPEEHAHGGKRKSLGRGLGALLGDAEFNIDEALNDTSTQPAQTPDDRVDVNLLFPSPFQPRKDFDEEALNALVESVKEKAYCNRFWFARKTAGLKSLPASAAGARPNLPDCKRCRLSSKTWMIRKFLKLLWLKTCCVRTSLQLRRRKVFSV